MQSEVFPRVLDALSSQFRTEIDKYVEEMMKRKKEIRPELQTEVQGMLMKAVQEHVRTLIESKIPPKVYDITAESAEPMVIALLW